MAGQRPLEPYIQVRILVSQLKGIFAKNIKQAYNRLIIKCGGVV